jgi:regulatory factor X 1/2/3
MNIPELGKISEENLQLPLNCTLEDVKKFEELYKQQCTTIFELFVALKMNSMKSVWMNFWRLKADAGDIPDEQHESGPSISFYEEQLSSEKFFSLCEVPQVYEFIKHCDFQFYQFCIEILIPDVFGFLPQQELNPIRKFAKSLEDWLTKALQNVPEKLKLSKLCIIKAFSMVLRRNTALNHLITTVHILFSNEQLINMSHDLNKVDFNYIKVRLMMNEYRKLSFFRPGVQKASNHF